MGKTYLLQSSYHVGGFNQEVTFQSYPYFFYTWKKFVEEKSENRVSTELILEFYCISNRNIDNRCLNFLSNPYIDIV